MTRTVVQGSFVRGVAGQLQPVSTARAQPVPGTAIPVDARLLRPSGPGQALPENVRERMERAFGASFADVRIHIGTQAASIGAVAFTSGSNIFFARGHYLPETPAGRQLIGHELAHVVQQRQGRVRVPPGTGPVIVDDPHLEAEAERAGMVAMKAPPASMPSTPMPPAGTQTLQPYRGRKFNPKQEEQRRRLFERRDRRFRQQEEATIRRRLARNCAHDAVGPVDAEGRVHGPLAARFRTAARDLRAAALADRGVLRNFMESMSAAPLLVALMQLITERFGTPPGPQTVSPTGPAVGGAGPPAGTLRLHRPAPALTTEPSVPRPMPRPRFGVWPEFQNSDIGSRAVVDMLTTLDSTSPWRAQTDVQTNLYSYRRHPGAVDLTSHVADAIERRTPAFTLRFPHETGEVMYAITEDCRIVVAARSGHQRDLPHPTLIGGIDPLALGGGLVEFRDGRISRVLVHSSGHFRPSGFDATEVALALFNRLPPGVFHDEFEGFVVYAGPTLQLQHRRGRRGHAPFRVEEGPDERGTTEQTRALERRRQMGDFERSLKSRNFDRALGTMRQEILLALFNPQTLLPLHLVPNRQVRSWLADLKALAARRREELVAEWIERHAGTVPSFQQLARDVIARELP